MRWQIGQSYSIVTEQQFNICHTLKKMSTHHSTLKHSSYTLQWRHNERDDVSNHQRLSVCSTISSGADQRKHQSFASLAFVIVTSGFPSQRVSDVVNVSIWWRHHRVFNVQSKVTVKYGGFIALMNVRGFAASAYPLVDKLITGNQETIGTDPWGARFNYGTRLSPKYGFGKRTLVGIVSLQLWH